MVVCVGLQLMMSPEGDAINRYRYNFMGGMLPFGLGLLYARYGEGLRQERWSPSLWGAGFILSCLLTYACSLLFSLGGQWLPPSSASEPSVWSSG